ncbi:Zinc finger protein ZAT1 [Cardamine amara subsp. amara]|uniref:Zinc finger protein ZAT1 n=1 Tax=Cardamine amara subsp. amara TaxID=228776 RepID=A0ABD1BE15_CARAN
MEEKHKCKLCWKSFVNGRALGGHMRSHILNHPLPIKLDPHPESASSSMADPGFVLQDRESETESSKKPTRKRSRLNRRSTYVSSRHHQSNEEEKSETGAAELKMMKIGVKNKKSRELSESCTEQEPVSSVSDAATAEEDVALSLMMLSRDKWEKEEEESDDERWEKKKKWFECETCEKVFKSYQALGGHRASHKKKREADHQVSDEKKKKKDKSSHHECPICCKVFSSGQALGGHKRSHASANTGPENRGIIISLIDLNLPAASEEDDLVSSVFNA